MRYSKLCFSLALFGLYGVRPALALDGSTVLRFGSVVILLTVSSLYMAIYFIIGCLATYNAITLDSSAGKSFMGALVSEFLRNKNTYFAVAMHILDQASDYQACAEYWREWQNQDESEKDNESSDISVDLKWWFCLSVMILLIHRMVSTIAIWVSTRSWLNTALQVFDLAMVRSVFEGHLSKRREPGNVQRHLQSIEAVFESFPQLVLSMVYLLRSRQANLAIVIQALFSIFTLANRICEDDAAFFPDPFREPQFGCKIIETHGWVMPMMNPLWFSRVFLFRVPEIFQRVAVLSLFWAMIGGEWLCVLIIVDFLICKLISHYMSQTRGERMMRIKSWFMDYLEPYQLNLNYRSNDYYCYILCFKFGVDSYEVWLLVRPCLAVFYTVVLGVVASSPDMGTGISRGSTMPNALESVLSIMIVVFALTPFLFQWVCRNTSKCDVCNPDLHYCAVKIMTGQTAKRDLLTAINERRWEVVAEMLRFGTDPNHLVHLMDESQMLMMLLEGCEPMEEFISGVDLHVCPEWCVSYPSDESLKKSDEQYYTQSLINQVDHYAGMLYVIYQMKGKQIGHHMTEPEDLTHSRMLLAGTILDLMRDTQFDFDFPLNKKNHLNGEWDDIFEYLILHLDWNAMLSQSCRQLHRYSVLFDYVLESSSDISIDEFLHHPFQMEILDYVPFNPLRMDIHTWMRVCFVLWCHSEMDKVKDSHWLPVLDLVAFEDWFEIMQSEKMFFVPVNVFARILHALKESLLLNKEEKEFQSVWIPRIAKLMKMLVLRSNFELELPFSREKHLNGEWDLLLDTLIDELNLDVLIHRDNPDITPISILFDYSVRDFIDFSHGKGIIPLTSFSVDFQMRFYPEQMTDRRGWLRLCFIAFSGNSPQSVGSEQWSALVSSIPSKVWCSAVSSMFKGWFIHTRSWIWESLAHCNPSVIFELFDQFADDWTEIADSDDHFVLRAHSEHKVTIPMSDELLTFWHITLSYLESDASESEKSILHDQLIPVIQQSDAHSRVFVSFCSVFCRTRMVGSTSSQEWRNSSVFKHKIMPLRDYLGELEYKKEERLESGSHRKYPKSVIDSRRVRTVSNIQLAD